MLNTLQDGANEAPDKQQDELVSVRMKIILRFSTKVQSRPARIQNGPLPTRTRAEEPVREKYFLVSP